LGFGREADESEGDQFLFFSCFASAKYTAGDSEARESVPTLSNVVLYQLKWNLLVKYFSFLCEISSLLFSQLSRTGRAIWGAE
jgi:hypothetical protein